MTPLLHCFTLPVSYYAKELRMTLDEVKKQFVEKIKQRAAEGHQYIDRKVEREIVLWSEENAISRDSARAALAQVCEAQDYVIESRVIAQLMDILEGSASRDRSIGEQQFNNAVLSCKRFTRGRRNEVQCMKLVIAVIEDNFKIRMNWFGDWYAHMKKTIGM
jgi:hypothetical protein